MSRNLDAVVAEKVMGWFVTNYWAAGVPRQGLAAPKGTILDIDQYPAYSSDIAAAWQVVEKMVDLGWHPKITGRFSGPTDPWWAGFTAQNCTGWNGRPDYAASDPDSLPTAICLAALRTVGVPVPETP